MPCTTSNHCLIPVRSRHYTDANKVGTLYSTTPNCLAAAVRSSGWDCDPKHEHRGRAMLEYLLKYRGGDPTAQRTVGNTPGVAIMELLRRHGAK